MTQHKTLFGMMNKSYNLIEIDRSDSIPNDYDTMNKVDDAIRSQDWSHLDNCIDEFWQMESRDNAIDYIVTELKEEFSRMDLSDCFDIDSYFEKWQDDIQYEIENRDISNPLRDIIRNTGEIVLFYDLNTEIVTPYDEAGYKENFKAIKKVLKIKGHEFDKDINSLIINASYGGSLVLYFTADINDMMNLTNKKKISFKNPNVAIIDTMNGSGDNEQFGIEFSTSFDTNNLRVDKSIRYNYTYAVCGMSTNWCDGTQVQFK
jgi:hypothetical protein